MQLTEKAWTNYINRLRRLNEAAGQKMADYIARHGTADTAALAAYAEALVTKYGEGSAELACQMYDAIAALQRAGVPPAEPAAPAGHSEVTRMVQATRNSPPQLRQGVSRMVKQAAADTTVKNALRDGAEWAWVPHGDTCPFCLTLASRGWQKASNAVLKGGHAEHIHANCDCEFAIRFDGRTGVAGYDPERYLAQYNAAGGDLNKLRRINYAANKDRINAQKRAAYAARLENRKKAAIIESKSFVTSEMLQKHYEKHLSEFNGISMNEYLSLANIAADRKASEDVVQLVRSDGSVSKYCFSTNEFVVVTAEGNIRTYFKPKEKAAYWDEEIKRNK